jgi:hypothetical protein
MASAWTSLQGIVVATMATTDSFRTTTWSSSSHQEVAQEIEGNHNQVDLTYVMWLLPGMEHQSVNNMALVQYVFNYCMPTLAQGNLDISTSLGAAFKIHYF